MLPSELSSLSLQSYFESRTTIRELEQRQFTTIQFFLGAFATLMGGVVGLLQFVKDPDRPLLSITLVILANILSVSLYFTWGTVTLMITRASSFCIDLINLNHSSQSNVFWESWLRSNRNKSGVPYLIESTLLIFLLPILTTFIVSLYFSHSTYPKLWLVNSIVTTIGAVLLISQYLWVLRQVKNSWVSPP